MLIKNKSIAVGDALYTDPDEVENFVKSTKCDSLAIAVGTSHGAYKFSGKAGLQFHILEKIQERLPGYPLVLHGASAVPMEEVLRINNAGEKFLLKQKELMKKLYKEPSDLEYVR